MWTLAYLLGLLFVGAVVLHLLARLAARRGDRRTARLTRFVAAQVVLAFVLIGLVSLALLWGKHVLSSAPP